MRFTPAIEFLISTTQTSLSWFHPLTGGRVLATTIIIIFLRKHLFNTWTIAYLTTYTAGKYRINSARRMEEPPGSFSYPTQPPYSLLTVVFRIKMTSFFQGFEDTMEFLHFLS